MSHGTRRAPFHASSPLCGPPSHTHTTADRFPQKAFPGHQFPLLPQLEFESPRHGRHDQGQLHLRHIPTHARSWPVAERDECSFLLLGQVVWVPAVGVEDVRIEGRVVGGVPDGGEVVDRVGGDGEDGALGEMVVAD